MRALILVAALFGCATDPAVPPPKAAPAAAPRDAGASDAMAAAPPDPAPVRAAEDKPAERAFADVGMKQLTEREWIAQGRAKIVARWKIDGEALRFSPTKTLVAFVQMPVVDPEKKPPKRPRPPAYPIVVVDLDGRRKHLFRPIRARGQDDPPKDLQFLGEDRLVYEVVQPPPAPPPPPKRGRGSKQVAAPPPPAPERPQRLFVIQPLRKRRPIRCQGVRFSFNGRKDHLAFVAGQPGAEMVSVDGAQVYPRRRGRTGIASDPAWARDQPALAFLEVRPTAPPRLVLLADVANPTGDTTWDLPPTAAPDGLRVFWANAQKLVVGRTVTRPVFATTFTIDRPADRERP